MAPQGTGHVVLDEAIDENYEPTEQEIREYAVWLGMDLETDGEFLWIAREGLKAPLPKPWKPCQSEDDEIFYFNFETGESVWDHPCDDHYRRLYKEEKARRDRASKDQSKLKKKGAVKGDKQDDAKIKRHVSFDLGAVPMELPSPGEPLFGKPSQRNLVFRPKEPQKDGQGEDLIVAVPARKPSLGPLAPLQHGAAQEEASSSSERPAGEELQAAAASSSSSSSSACSSRVRASVAFSTTVDEPEVVDCSVDEWGRLQLGRLRQEFEVRWRRRVQEMEQGLVCELEGRRAQLERQLTAELEAQTRQKVEREVEERARAWAADLERERRAALEREVEERLRTGASQLEAEVRERVERDLERRAEEELRPQMPEFLRRAHEKLEHEAEEAARAQLAPEAQEEASARRASEAALEAPRPSDPLGEIERAVRQGLEQRVEDRLQVLFSDLEKEARAKFASGVEKRLQQRCLRVRRAEMACQGEARERKRAQLQPQDEAAQQAAQQAEEEPQQAAQQADQQIAQAAEEEPQQAERGRERSGAEEDVAECADKVAAESAAGGADGLSSAGAEADAEVDEVDGLLARLGEDLESGDAPELIDLLLERLDTAAVASRPQRPPRTRAAPVAQPSPAEGVEAPWDPPPEAAAAAHSTQAGASDAAPGAEAELEEEIPEDIQEEPEEEAPAPMQEEEPRHGGAALADVAAAAGLPQPRCSGTSASTSRPGPEAAAAAGVLQGHACRAERKEDDWEEDTRSNASAYTLVFEPLSPSCMASENSSEIPEDLPTPSSSEAGDTPSEAAPTVAGTCGAEATPRLEAAAAALVQSAAKAAMAAAVLPPASSPAAAPPPPTLAPSWCPRSLMRFALPACLVVGAAFAALGRLGAQAWWSARPGLQPACSGSDPVLGTSSLTDLSELFFNWSRSISWGSGHAGLCLLLLAVALGAALGAAGVGSAEGGPGRPRALAREGS